MKNILLTGASGFVGSALMKKLVHEGHNVNVFLRKDYNNWRIKHYLKDVNTFILNLQDEDRVKENVNKIKPDIIMHLAANEASCAIEASERDISTNINGTWNLLKSLSNVDYELFINAGSSSEYGKKSSSMIESDLLEPNSYHSFSKGAQTLLCQTCAKVENKPIVSLRFFSVYGPFERLSRLIPNVIRCALHNKQVNLSSPTVSRDFIYIDDVVDACMNFSNLSKLSGEIINLGTGIQSNIEKVVDIVSDVTKKDILCKWNSDSRSWDTEIWVADCEKSRKMLQWEAKYDIRQGLSKTVQWTIEYENTQQ